MIKNLKMVILFNLFFVQFKSYRIIIDCVHHSMDRQGKGINPNLTIVTKSINQTKIGESELIDSQIPILDMQSQQFPKKLINQFREIGFAIVQNHGIPKQVIDQAFEKGRDFFMWQRKEKRKFLYNAARSRGYAGPGEEILDQNYQGNQKKETLNLGHPDGKDEIQFYPSQSLVKSSKDIYESLFQSYKTIMKAMEKGMGLQEGYITSRCCKDYHLQTLRYLFYPEVTLEEIEKTGRIRAGAHSDYGTVTLLFQKPGPGQNGLMALNSEKKWVRVNPPDYCMVINLGDLFQHWSNDCLKSTIHKVQVDEDVYEMLKKGILQKAPERQTIVLFCDPDEGQILNCLPGFGQPKYTPVNGKQYVFGRIKSTYALKSS